MGIRGASTVILLWLAAACSGRSSEATTPAPSQGSSAGDSVAQGSPNGLDLDPAWKKCATDADCEIAAYGCCSKLSSNRQHHADTLAKLRSSTYRYCPVKSACGRGSDGTDEGMPAECNRGSCVLPIVLPDEATSCDSDSDCVVAMLDCCNKVAVRQSYEHIAVGLIQEVEADRPSCPPSASCPDPPPMCKEKRCVRR